MATIRLERFNYGPGDSSSPVTGTFGVFTLPSGRELYTVERPWLQNKPFESCIPEGVYRLKKRRSNVVKTTSGGEYLDGWEVTGVPGRSLIMLHVANWPRNVEGCIGVGLAYGILSGSLAVLSGSLAVLNSLNAFRILMDELDGDTEHDLHITGYVVQYP